MKLIGCVWRMVSNLSNSQASWFYASLCLSFDLDECTLVPSLIFQRKRGCVRKELQGPLLSNMLNLVVNTALSHFALLHKIWRSRVLSKKKKYDRNDAVEYLYLLITFCGFH